jgi:hypothetical protein
MRPGTALLGLALCAVLAACAATPPPADGVVDAYALLAERNAFREHGLPDLDVAHRNTARLRALLLSLGWRPDHIREAREFDAASLREAMGWLAARADPDDLVLCYVFSHGSFLEDEVEWSSRFPAHWEEVPGGSRALIVDACRAGALVEAARRGGACLAVGAVGERELAWAGEPGEGLPVVGGVFTHYLVEAAEDPAADTDRDGSVSLQEAASLADARQRAYLHAEVLSVPRFLRLFHEAGHRPELDPGYPRVVVRDGYGRPFRLDRRPGSVR